MNTFMDVIITHKPIVKRGPEILKREIAKEVLLQATPKTIKVLVINTCRRILGIFSGLMLDIRLPSPREMLELEMLTAATRKAYWITEIKKSL